MKKILAVILAACGLASTSATAGELRVLATTPTGDRAYIIPVDGSLAPTVNLAVPRNTQALMIGYVAESQPGPAAAAPSEPAPQAEASDVAHKEEPVETYSSTQDAAAPEAPANDEAPAERTRLYASAKAGFGFLKIKDIKMTSRQAMSNPTMSGMGVSWLEDSSVSAEGGNKARGVYAYAAGLEVPMWLGAFRFEFEYNESDNHIYDLYSDSSDKPMRLTLSPMTRFFNLYWDLPGLYRRFDGGDAVRLYVGAGVGMSKIRAHAMWEDDSIGAFYPGEKFYTDTRVVSRDKAYNYAGGIAFWIGNHLAFDFGYRHVNYGKIRGTTENFFTLVDTYLGAPAPVSLSNVEAKTRANEFFGGIRLSF